MPINKANCALYAEFYSAFWNELEGWWALCVCTLLGWLWIVEWWLKVVLIDYYFARNSYLMAH